MVRVKVRGSVTLISARLSMVLFVLLVPSRVMLDYEWVAVRAGYDGIWLSLDEVMLGL